MKKERLLALPLIGLAMLGVVSCGDSSESSGIVEPNSDSLASITLDSNKMKTTYYEGQKLDLTGLVVKANYEMVIVRKLLIILGMNQLLMLISVETSMLKLSIQRLVLLKQEAFTF